MSANKIIKTKFFLRSLSFRNNAGIFMDELMLYLELLENNIGNS